MTETYDEIRASVRALCSRFPGPYWRQLDRERAYPEAFVRALTEAGFLAALIPPEYGGSGLGLGAACAILEEVQRSAQGGPDRAALANWWNEIERWRDVVRKAGVEGAF